MRRTLIAGDRKKNSKKSQVSSSESKDKKSTLIKTQSDFEKEFDIPSYDEYKIKDTNSIMDYDDEDVETKMIRLVFLKKRGENMKDKINIKKKYVSRKSDNYSKMQKIKIAVNLLEKLRIRRKKKVLFKYMKAKKFTLGLKIASNFLNKIKKYIMKVYIKNVYNLVFANNKSEGPRESLISRNKKGNLMMYSPQLSNKKIKKFKFPKVLKLDFVSKKTGQNKNGGVGTIYQRVEKDIENEKILGYKLRKLNNIKKKEREYMTRMNQKKKKLRQEIELYKKNNNIGDVDVSQIKKNNNISDTDTDSYFFSNDNSNKSETFHLGTAIKSEESFKITRKKKQQKTTKEVKSSKILKGIKQATKEKENYEDIYSINKKKSNISKNRIEKNNLLRGSVQNVRSNKKLDKSDSKKMRRSLGLTGINFRNKLSKELNEPNAKKPEEDNNHLSNNKEITNLNDSENLFKEEEENKKNEKSKTFIQTEIEAEDEELDITDEEEGGEISDSNEEEFIQIPEDRNEYEENLSLIENEKVDLVEYDTFYKEQFFKDELFKYDAENLKDKEYEKIQKEMTKLDIKRKLKEKTKLKEVNEIKGINTDKLKKEIDILNEKYKNIKKVVKQKLKLNIDTTEEFVNKGRLLNLYFLNNKEKNFPRFSIESEEELGAQEIIDFKPLRKEELSRRYFDRRCCFEQRKKIHDFRISMRYSCKYFVDNWIFELISTIITLSNCLCFFLSDPTNPYDLWNYADNYFLIFYMLEAGLKINTFSFYSGENAYLKDYWNLLDLLVVIMGILNFILERIAGNEKRKVSGFNGIKAFRILKPLKTLKNFRNLKNLIQALIASISRLWEIFIVLFFFFLFFAAAGLQMWQGLFMRRCMNINYGYLLTDKRNTYLCSYSSDCASLNTYGDNYICSKGYTNPNNGATNFDNILYSLITIFIMVTLEGWSNIFTYVSKTFKDKIYFNPIIIFIFFHAFIYIGAFYLINLFLAVTNSEFEHIERSRKELNQKKSFFGLIKSAYDPKERKKRDKKEAEKKLKLKNDKKSDEALKSLYYKIKEEAFHIHKNKRSIPKVYSTVKDIYIMANNNPEELYLEKQRIKDEENDLCKDVKRRQKEILLRLKKNKLEMEESKISANKINKTKTIANASIKEENKNEDKKINYKFTFKNLLRLNTLVHKDSESADEQKENKIVENNLTKNLIKGNISADLKNINNLKNEIDIGVIELAKDKTDKYFNEKRISQIKLFEKFKAERKLKTKAYTKTENINNNQISFFDDIKCEKKEVEIRVINRAEELHNYPHKPRKQANPRARPEFNKNPSSKDIFFRNRKSIKNNNNIKQLNKQLSCINDLALSSLSENSESNSADKKKKNLKNKLFTHIHSKKNMKLTNLILNDYNQNFENFSFDNDLFNNSLFLNSKRKSVNLKDTSMDNLTNISENAENKNKSIINTKHLIINDDINLKSKFERPHSTLNYIIKYNADQKFHVENIRFNLKKYLKKEAEKDTEFLNKDRRKSFLGFLEYAQLQKDQKELEELIQNDDKDKISSFSGKSNNNNNDSYYTDNSLHFLSEESFLSRNNTISVDDIDLLPRKLNEKNIYPNEYLLHEHVKRNMDSNKLTQNIRAEVFYRDSVNTNVNLTTNEMKKYYEEINKKLDEQLYVNKKKIRMRDNKTNCNVSGIIKYTNYNKNLKTVKRDEKNESGEENEEEEDKNKNINNNTNINIVEKKRDSLGGLNNNNNNNNNINSNNNNENYNYIKSAEFSKKIGLKSPRKRKVSDVDKNENSIPKKGLSSKKLVIKDIKNEEKNSEYPLLTNQKTLNILNLKTKNKYLSIKNNDKKVDNSNNSIFNKSFLNPKNKSINSNKTEANNKNKIKNTNQTFNKSLSSKLKDNTFIFKAKSIDKNIKKYPKADSGQFIVNEENKESKDLLTTEQELIPTNLRGKKYYMNYLYNIMDIDLKVKDNFRIYHWSDEIQGKKVKFIELKKLPMRTDAFFVFNDKYLKLKKYKYIYYTDYKYKKNELTYLSTKLKYLPLNVIVLMPKRLRNFSKYSLKQTPNLLALKDHINIYQKSQTFENSIQNPLNFYPNSALVSSIGYTNNPPELKRVNTKYSTVQKNTSKGNLTMSSAFSKNYVIQKEISFIKDIFDKISKKIEHFNYLTLSHYFLREEDLKFKLMETKRQEDLINERREKNRYKYNRMKIKNEVQNILLYDLKTNSHTYVKWSGEDVLYNKDIDKHKKNWNKLIKSLENFNMIIWNENSYMKRVQKVRYAFYILANNDYFEYVILSIVILNSIILSLEGNLLRPEYLLNVKYLNIAFNLIFLLEYIIKFVGLTPLVYYSDAFSYLDTAIIAFTIIDMATPDDNSGTFEAKRTVSSQLAFFRVFRIFRVIRLAKVLRKLKSMRIIIVSIKKSLTNVTYIIIILILFILIFQLLGMSLLYQNRHYQTFLEAFYTTYQILTLENWDSIFYEIWPMNKFCIFYFVFWIFIGNYILFNLFISILIQSFSTLDLEDEDDLTEDDIIERIYPLPDYLYALKNNIIDNNYIKINEKRRANKEPINNLLFSSGTLSNPKEGAGRNSSSNINLANMSKLSIDTDEDEELAQNEFSKSTEIIKEDLNDIDNPDKKYTMIEKRMLKWQKINKLFKKNDCEDSLYLFSQSNGFRILCMNLINHALFDKFILFIIILSTVRLIIDTFVSGYTLALFFDLCDSIFNLIFLFEAVIKIIAMGFAFDEGSYLRDNWNKMDALIVICSFFEFHSTASKYFYSDKNYSSLEFLKVLRLLRTLRPLRFISHNDNLKLIITSLFDSALPILNTLFILIIVLLMFSIVGVSLFYTYFHNCYVLENNGIFTLPKGPFTGEFLAENNIGNDMESISRFCADRYNGIMDTGPAFKFSNIIDAFVTSYVLSTMEGWPDIMNSYRIYENSYGIFFVVFNLVIAYFFLNLFTGIMFKYFNEAYKREQKLDSDDKKAAKYYDFLTQIMSAQSDYITWKKPPKGSIQYYLREIVDSEYFENTMLGVILFNFIILCLAIEDSSENYHMFLKVNNKIITILFTIELILKLAAYGFNSFFHLNWNIFDFILVIISYIDWKFEDIEGVDSSFLRTFQLIRVIRVLRVSRVLRLIKALKGLEKLIQTLQWSISALSNVLFLTIVIYGTIALLGCYLYQGDYVSPLNKNSYYINEYFNFLDFYSSYLLIFRCSTGENWHNIMIEYAYFDERREGGYYFFFFFFILDNFITSVILLNLLLMVTLQQYDEFTDKKYNPIDKFNSFIKDFNNAWNKFSTDEDDGYRIKKMLVAKFLIELNLQKIIFPENNKLGYAKKYVGDLKLYYDKEDYVYYHDVIFKILYKLYGTKINRENPDNNLIFKTEKKILKQIKININKYIQKKIGSSNKNEKQKIVLITFNPLTAHLYYKFSFAYLKIFINNYKENAYLIEHLKENIAPVLGDRENSKKDLESSELSESNNKDQEDENDKEEDEEEEDDENNENEEGEENNENEEGESLNNEESEQKDRSSSFNVPDNNLYKYYKDNNNNQENKSDKEMKEMPKADK